MATCSRCGEIFTSEFINNKTTTNCEYCREYFRHITQVKRLSKDKTNQKYLDAVTDFELFKKNRVSLKRHKNDFNEMISKLDDDSMDLMHEKIKIWLERKEYDRVERMMKILKKMLLLYSSEKLNLN